MTVDLADFEPVVAQAMDAFRNDSSYAVSMASKASSIIAKRRVWELRKELRTAEATARTQCAVSEIQLCGVNGPCGTGACPFAVGDLKKLTPCMAKSGKPVPRPVPGAVPNYNIETVIKQLVSLRSGRSEPVAVG